MDSRLYRSGSSGAVRVLECRAYNLNHAAPVADSHSWRRTLHPGCCLLPGPVKARPQPPRWTGRASGA